MFELSANSEKTKKIKGDFMQKKVREGNASKADENDMINHPAPAIIVFTFSNERREKTFCAREYAHHSVCTYLHLVA